MTDRIFKTEHLPSGMTLYSSPPDDAIPIIRIKSDSGWEEGDNTVMNEITRQELRDTLSAIEERMDRRIDRMADDARRGTDEYRRELELRDEALQREQAMREEAFKREQAVRDKAMDERFSSFLSIQAERDSQVKQQFEKITRDIDRLGSIKANVWGAMVTTIIILLAFATLALTAFQAGGIRQPAAQVETMQPVPPAPTALLLAPAVE